MTLPTTGTISLSDYNADSLVRREPYYGVVDGYGTSNQFYNKINMNGTDVRYLTGTSSGAQVSVSTGYGKTGQPALINIVMYLSGVTPVTFAARGFKIDTSDNDSLYVIGIARVDPASTTRDRPVFMKLTYSLSGGYSVAWATYILNSEDSASTWTANIILKDSFAYIQVNGNYERLLKFNKSDGSLAAQGSIISGSLFLNFYDILIDSSGTTVYSIGEIPGGSGLGRNTAITRWDSNAGFINVRCSTYAETFAFATAAAWAASWDSTNTYLYLVGTAAVSVTAGSSSAPNMSNQKTFIQKIDTSISTILWTRIMHTPLDTTSGTSNWATSVHVDASDNIYIAGNYFNTTTAPTFVKTYVVKLSSDASTVLWGRHLSFADNSASPYGINLHSDGYLYVNSAFSNRMGRIVMDPSTGAVVQFRSTEPNPSFSSTSNAIRPSGVNGNSGAPQFDSRGNVLWLASHVRSTNPGTAVIVRDKTYLQSAVIAGGPASNNALREVVGPDNPGGATFQHQFLNANSALVTLYTRQSFPEFNAYFPLTNTTWTPGVDIATTDTYYNSVSGTPYTFAVSPAGFPTGWTANSSVISPASVTSTVNISAQSTTNVTVV